MVGRLVVVVVKEGGGGGGVGEQLCNTSRQQPVDSAFLQQYSQMQRSILKT